MATSVRKPSPKRAPEGAGYLQKILTARVYDVAVESALDPAPALSARLANRILFFGRPRSGRGARGRKKPEALPPRAESTNEGGGGDNRLDAPAAALAAAPAGSNENQCRRFFAALQYGARTMECTIDWLAAN